MNNKKIKIFWLSAEAAPLAKVGGLGDVAGSLPKALQKEGIDVRLSLPYYGSIKTPAKLLLKGLKMSLNKKTVSFDVYSTVLPNTKVPVYLIKHPLFKEAEVYAKTNEFNHFALWSKASLVLITALDFIPDILHLHDWQAALALHFLPEFKLDYPAVFSRVKVLYTIHNLANQGYDRRSNINPMAEGILGANYVSTVSPSYAREILTVDYGVGLEKVLKKRRRNLFGILNGIDINLLNPKTDINLKYHYSVRKLSGKKKNKLSLQSELGLVSDDKKPLLTFISRLSWQKGIELFSDDLLGEIIKKYDAQLVFLGDGENKYEKQLIRIAKKYPQNIKVFLKLDLVLAQKLYAASDFFLMPSRFEPCGLTQMMAMRYGSLPIVHSVGGLKDTVNSSVGYSFKNYLTIDFQKTIIRALGDFYFHPEIIQKKRQKAMEKDFSWGKAALKYFKLYQKMIR
ncbi:MAG: glycogen synthase [Patescibacteria group bacterium]